MGSFVENINKVSKIITSGVLDPNAEGYSNAVIASNMAAICTNIYDQFDDRYLGSKSIAPMVDNDGNSLVYGALFFDNVNNFMKVWSNAGWINVGNSETAYTVAAVENLVSVPSDYTTAIVKDLDRGGTFIWSASGTANGGTVFAGATGYWIRQYSGAVNVKWFGAKGDGVNDDSINVLVALNNHNSVFIPDNFTLYFKTQLVMPSGKTFFGLNKLTSRIQLIGDIEGLILSQYSTVHTLRIIGNINMTVDTDGRKKACINIGSLRNSAARSEVYNCFFGGTTLYYDNVDMKITGAGIKTGDTFLNSITDCVILAAELGHDGTAIRVTEGAITHTVTHNSLTFSHCEFIACTIGQKLQLARGVLFSNCTWEGNSQKGLYLGACFGVTLQSCYFEANGSSKTSGNNDIYISSAGLEAYSIYQIGWGLSINDCVFSNGRSIFRSIEAYGQQNINITNATFNDAYSNMSVIYIEGASNSCSGSLNNIRLDTHTSTNSFVVVPAHFNITNVPYALINHTNSPFIASYGKALADKDAQYINTIYTSGISSNRDLYEEGVFTPVIEGTTTAGIATYSQQVGKYTRIGNVVNFSINVSITAHTGTGSIKISGLPFVSSSTVRQGVSICRTDNLTFTGQLAGFIDISSSNILLVTVSPNAVIGTVAIDTNFLIWLSGSYLIN